MFCPSVGRIRYRSCMEALWKSHRRRPDEALMVSLAGASPP
jgi:hypothetical protein